MPFIDNAGGNSLADTINGAGDRIRGAAEGMYARDNAQQESNRALHPLNQKWLEKVISGEMSPADAAVQAHKEIDAHEASQAPSGGGKLQIDGEQGGGGMTSGMPPPPPVQPGNLSADSQRILSQGSGGGMGRAAQPMTQRDLSDAQGIAKTASPFARAGASKYAADMRAGSATNTENGKNNRADARLKHDEKKLKEKGSQFDAMMQYRYDALKEDMNKTMETIRSRHQLQQNEQGDKAAIELLKGDMKTVAGMNEQVVKLQNEMTRAGDMLTPEQEDKAREMIEDRKAKIKDLEYSIQVQMKERGQRRGIDAEPGSPDNNPMHGTSGLRGAIERTGRQPASMDIDTGESMPELPTDIPVRDPMALPEGKGGGNGSNMVWIEDIATKKRVQVPADTAEESINKMGIDAWRKKYRAIKGVQ